MYLRRSLWLFRNPRWFNKGNNYSRLDIVYVLYRDDNSVEHKTIKIVSEMKREKNQIIGKKYLELIRWSAPKKD